MDAIKKMLQNGMGAVELDAWQAGTYEGAAALDLSARYFTPRQNSTYERGQSFAAGVDPNGILAELRGQGLIHGNDNKVEYLKDYKNEHGETK